MRLTAFLKIITAGAMLLAGVAAALATGADRPPFMATRGPTAQPIGHHEFCRSHPAECGVQTTASPRVSLTPGRWNALVAINADVNAKITPVTDDELFGRAEVWEFPRTMGDCEDMVLLKRRLLIQRGWPVGSLLITVVRQQNGDGHAVLTVLTDRGDLVLDNLDGRIRVWSQTPYRYVKRQSEFDSGKWVSVQDGRASQVGSLKP